MNRWSPLFLVVMAVTFMTLGLAFSPATGSASSEIGPTSPAPTWTPGPPPLKTPLPSPAGLDGAVIELNVLFPASWPWREIGWQDLWTIVQWQDAFGNWHDVTGWQGGLDSISQQDGEYVGSKMWWAGREQAVPGVFRWLVLQDKDGARLGASESFTANTTNRVRVELSSPSSL